MTSVRLPADLAGRVAARAAAERRSVAQMTALLVEQGLRSLGEGAVAAEPVAVFSPSDRVQQLIGEAKKLVAEEPEAPPDSGIREPRRPLPPDRSGTATLEPPEPAEQQEDAVARPLPDREFKPDFKKEKKR